jgi:hypothetical protein
LCCAAFFPCSTQSNYQRLRERSAYRCAGNTLSTTKNSIDFEFESGIHFDGEIFGCKSALDETKEFGFAANDDEPWHVEESNRRPL